MKEIDETPVPESESEMTLEVRVGLLEALVASAQVELARLSHDVRAAHVELADLHHRRRVSRHQAYVQDPEWFS